MSKVRFRFWDGQVVSGIIRRRFLCFSLIDYGIDHLDESGKVQYVYRKAKWFPNWRILG